MESSGEEMMLLKVDFFKCKDDMPQKIAIRYLNVIIMVILGNELLNNSEKVEILLKLG